MPKNAPPHSLHDAAEAPRLRNPSAHRAALALQRHDFRSLLPTPRSSAALIGNSSLGASHSDPFVSSHEAKTRQPEGEQGQRGRLGNTESVGFLKDVEEKAIRVGSHVNGEHTDATKIQSLAIQHVTTESGSERFRCSLEKTVKTKRGPQRPKAVNPREAEEIQPRIAAVGDSPWNTVDG